MGYTRARSGLPAAPAPAPASHSCSRALVPPMSPTTTVPAPAGAAAAAAAARRRLRLGPGAPQPADAPARPGGELGLPPGVAIGPANPNLTFCASACDGGHVHIRDICPYSDFIAVLTPKVDSLMEVKTSSASGSPSSPASAFPAHRTARALEGGAAFGDGPMMILGEQHGEG